MDIDTGNNINSTGSFFAGGSRRRVWITVLLVLSIVAVASVVVVAAVTLGGPGGDGRVLDPGTHDKSSSKDSADDDTATSAPTPRSMALLPGKETENDVQVGYPRHRVGAVSAATEYVSKLGSTLDVSRAEEIAEVVTDPEHGYDPSGAKHYVKTRREAMGLPPAGELPADASVTTAAAAAQVRDESNSEITVLLLAYVSMSAHGANEEVHGVFTTRLGWIDGDWKVIRGGDDVDTEGLNVEPGSTEAEKVGWIEVTR